ncbi:hypothetical protein ACHAWF_010310 [Thalassiosira exigua]
MTFTQKEGRPTMNPASWNASEVEAWARQVGLSDATIAIIQENEIDGPTLVTLEKDELRSELGITSLPSRRYLWDLILTLRSHQGSSDRTKAIDVFEEEIDTLSSKDYADASAGGKAGTDERVVIQLRSDAAEQRQIISDHIMALRLQATWGQQTYEDAELARCEEERLRQLAVQSEFDRRYAQTLDGGRRGRHVENEENKNEIASLFGLSIQACVSNKVNVAEALANGDIKVIPRLQDIQEINEAEDAVEIEEMNSAEKRKVLNSLPFINQCNICLEEFKQGFSLACEHSMCINCTRDLFLAAVRDSSLLPLRCCEVPIDMNICRHLLLPEDVHTLTSRMTELEATNKMYCPNCNKFINLDLIDAQESTELLCVCSTALCISCKSTAHPRFSCAENRAISSGDDDLLLEMSQRAGWKQCPGCNTMIELAHGCNHMTCATCRYEFCYKCLSPWGGGQCSSGNCEVWDEDRLLAAGEARVEAEENARRRPMPAVVREERVQQAMRALRENEGCDHEWVRRNGYLGNCERCGYDLPCYGMICVSDCQSTVCYTCANFRIPRTGWR